MENLAGSGPFEGLSFSSLRSGKYTKDELEGVKREIKELRRNHIDIPVDLKDRIHNFFGDFKASFHVYNKEALKVLNARRTRVLEKTSKVAYKGAAIAGVVAAVALALRFVDMRSVTQSGVNQLPNDMQFEVPEFTPTGMLKGVASGSVTFAGSVLKAFGNPFHNMKKAVGYSLVGYFGANKAREAATAAVEKLQNARSLSGRVALYGMEKVQSVLEFGTGIVSGITGTASDAIRTARDFCNAIRTGTRNKWDIAAGFVNRTASRVNNFMVAHKTKILLALAYVGMAVVARGVTGEGAPTVYPEVEYSATGALKMATFLAKDALSVAVNPFSKPIENLIKAAVYGGSAFAMATGTKAGADGLLRLASGARSLAGRAIMFPITLGLQAVSGVLGFGTGVVSGVANVGRNFFSAIANCFLGIRTGANNRMAAIRSFVNETKENGTAFFREHKKMILLAGGYLAYSTVMAAITKE